MKRTGVALVAETAPPSILSDFDWAVLPLESAELSQFADFRLSCAACKGDRFQILGFPKTITDPSEFSGAALGDTLFRPPHRLKCLTCQRAAPLFDVRKHGYDGVLGHLPSYESGDEGEAPHEGAFTVVVSFAYNAEAEELDEIASEAGVRPADLFDWITILAKNTDTGEVTEFGYECA